MSTNANKCAKHVLARRLQLVKRDWESAPFKKALANACVYMFSCLHVYMFTCDITISQMRLGISSFQRLFAQMLWFIPTNIQTIDMLEKFSNLPEMLHT